MTFECLYVKNKFTGIEEGDRFQQWDTVLFNENCAKLPTRDARWRLFTSATIAVVAGKTDDSLYSVFFINKHGKIERCAPTEDQITLYPSKECDKLIEMLQRRKAQFVN